jgi:hypothetical protein
MGESKQQRLEDDEDGDDQTKTQFEEAKYAEETDMGRDQLQRRTFGYGKIQQSIY